MTVMYSKARIGRFPLHPILVSFPIVFYTLTFVGFLLFWFNGSNGWFKAGLYSNIAGVIFAVVASLAGFIDWLAIPGRHKGKFVGFYHMMANVVALLLFIINAIIQYNQLGKVMPEAISGVLLSGAGFFMTVFAAGLGWNLVSKHHIGIDLSVEQQVADLKEQTDFGK